MLACVDVDYRARESIAAGLLLRDFTDERPVAEWVERLPPPAPYEPGQFYLRELPCLLRVLARAPAPPAVVVIDGYVWLDGAGRPGLGAHLHEALDRRVAVVGVAKTAFHGSAFAVPVLRGDSTSPLYVTAAGMDPEAAAAAVRRMHGPYRLPAMLKRVDRLARES